MVQIIGNAVRVLRQRTIRSRNDEFGFNIPQQNLQTREGDWYRKEFGNAYRLSQEVRDRGIAQCGQWAGRQVTFSCKAIKKVFFFFLTFKLGPFQIHSQLKESIHLSIHMPTGNPMVKEKSYCLVTLDGLPIWVASHLNLLESGLR